MPTEPISIHKRSMPTHSAESQDIKVFSKLKKKKVSLNVKRKIIDRVDINNTVAVHML